MVDYANATIEWGTSTITLLGLMKQMNDICDTDTSQDETLSLWLQMAGEAAENYVDNKLVTQAVTERMVYKRSPVPLRYWPAGPLASVVIDGNDETTDWSTYIEDGITWITLSDTGRSVTCAFDQVDVSYQAGFDPLPADAGYAIVRTAIGYGNNAGGTTGAVKKESIVGVGSIEYADSGEAETIGLLSPTTIAVLDKYKRLHV